MSANRILRNSTKRAERVATWNEEAAQGNLRRPKVVEGRKALSDWLYSIYDAQELSATDRLVAIVLALFGNADGTRIYPGIRELASRCNLSPRAVSKSISGLVCHGRLKRRFRAGAAGAGRGFEYLLTIPTVCTTGQHSVCIKDQHRDEGVCTLGQHSGQVCTDGQHSVHPGAHSVHPDDTAVCTHGAPTSVLPIQIPGAGATPAAPGELAKARPARRRTGPNVVTLEPLEERLRKARTVIVETPDIGDDKLARMFRLDPDQIRKARTA